MCQAILAAMAYRVWEVNISRHEDPRSNPRWVEAWPQTSQVLNTMANTRTRVADLYLVPPNYQREYVFRLDLRTMTQTTRETGRIVPIRRILVQHDELNPVFDE